MELEQPRAGKHRTKEKQLGRHGCRGKSRLRSDVGSRGQQLRVDRKEKALHSGLRVHHFLGISPVWIKPPLTSQGQREIQKCVEDPGSKNFLNGVVYNAACHCSHRRHEVFPQSVTYKWRISTP